MDVFMNTLQLVGGIILSIGYIPQIRKILKTKSVVDFDKKYLLALTIGVGFMEIYAIYNVFQKIAIMFFVTNTLAFCLALFMLVLYYKYRKNKRF